MVMGSQQRCLCQSLDFNALFFNGFLQYARFLPLVTDLEDDELTYLESETSTVSRDRDGYLADTDPDMEYEQEAMRSFLASVNYGSDLRPDSIRQFLEQKLQAPLYNNTFVAEIGTLSEVESRSSSCDVCALFLDTRLWRLSKDCDGAYAQGDDRDPACVRSDWLFYLVPIWPAWKTMWQKINESPNELYILPVPDASRLPLEVIDDGFHSHHQIRDLRTICLLNHPRSLWQSMSAHVNWNQVATWLPPFNPKKNSSAMLGPPQSKYFMVMDVIHSRIVKVTTLNGLCFAALSYVWGTAKVSEPWCQRIQQYHDRKSDSPAPYNASSLPKTVQGALEICGMLQIPYLWIDALCIKQKSSQEKAQAIADMAHIYADSYICIVAAANADVHTALPGVNLPRSILKLDVNGLLIGISPVRPSDNVQKSIWNSRGWTFQEAMLPETSLVILQDQIFLQSARSLWCEYVDHDVGNAYTSPSDDYYPEPLTTLALYATNPDDGPTDWFGVYKDMVENYSNRQLTYQSDAQNAFSGLLLTIAKRFDITLNYALPTSNLVQSMNWHRRDILSKAQARRDESGSLLFPSYAWLSVNGPVRYTRVPNDRSLDRKFLPQILPQVQQQQYSYPAGGFEGNFAVRDTTGEGSVMLEGAIPMITRLHAVDHKSPSTRGDDKAYIYSMFKQGTFLDNDEELPEGQLYCLPVLYKGESIVMALIVQVFLYPFTTVTDWPRPTKFSSCGPVVRQRPISHRLVQAEMEKNVYLVRRVGILPYAFFQVDIEWPLESPIQQLVHLLLA